jgi:hypothetical protein
VITWKVENIKAAIKEREFIVRIEIQLDQDGSHC